MAAAGLRMNAKILQPRILPFSSVLSDGRKTSRKKMKAELAKGEFYPGQGHCQVELDTLSYIFFGKLLLIVLFIWAVSSSNICQISWQKVINGIYILYTQHEVSFHNVSWNILFSDINRKYISPYMIRLVIVVILCSSKFWIWQWAWLIKIKHIWWHALPVTIRKWAV